MVFFGFLAAITTRLELVTGILILPQRQTVLVAKQTAEVDVLSGGRLRVGIGIGWNYVEYDALGESFQTRGRRVEEQIELLRRLWAQALVDFQGKWHQIPDAGINPLPRRLIPLWLGGQSEPVIRRAAHIADGWMPLYASPEQARPGLDLLERCLAEAGRSRDEFGLQVRIAFGEGVFVTAGGTRIAPGAYDLGKITTSATGGNPWIDQDQSIDPWPQTYFQLDHLLLDVAFGSAPFSISVFTTSAWPSAAAHIKAVCPFRDSVAFTLAPAAIKCWPTACVGAGCRPR